MALNHRVAKYTLQHSKDMFENCPPHIIGVLDLLIHLPHFYGVLKEADEDKILEAASSELIDEFRIIYDQSMTYGLESIINVKPLFLKMEKRTGRNYLSENLSPEQVLRDLIEQLSTVPRLCNIFCGQSIGQLSSVSWFDYRSYGKTDSPVNVAIFDDNTHTVEESLYMNIRRALRNENTHCKKFKVVPPPIFIINVVSSIVYESANLNSLINPTALPPSEIKFSESFDLSSCVKDLENPFEDGVALKYNLMSTLSSSGQQHEKFAFYFRKNMDSNSHWHGGYVGSDINSVEKRRAIDENYFRVDSEVHPRILVYSREDFHKYLQHSTHILSTGNTNSMHVDSCFDNNDPKDSPVRISSDTDVDSTRHDRKHHNYCDSRVDTVEDSTRRSGNGSCFDNDVEITCTEDDEKETEVDSPSHISASSGLSHSALEEQADLALANRRLKDASDIYIRALKASSSQSTTSSSMKEVNRSLEEKRDKVSSLIKIDSSVSLIEKGERALTRGAFTEARAHYAKAAHSQSDISYLRVIIAEIDSCIKLQTASQKIVEAHAAMRTGHYQAADELFRSAIHLNPEKAPSLSSVQAALIPLMQTESAQGKQKVGMIALEEKRCKEALMYLNEALELLPDNSPHFPSYLCDRAYILCELKEFTEAISNCENALSVQPDHGLAYFRLGIAYFGLDRLDDAHFNYEKALKLDASLSEMVKIKLKQVNSAREVQQRKEREAERIRQKEEAQKALLEKRAREDLIKKEKGEKAALERAEKLERARIKEEDRKAKAGKEKALQAMKDLEKEQERERLREERLKKDAERVLERERAKMEKEKDRERARREKEQRAMDQKRLKEEEKRRKEEFAEEMARVEMARKTVEREKEAEREKAIIDMENLIAERGKQRLEKAFGSSSVIESRKYTEDESAGIFCTGCNLLIDCKNHILAFGHCNHKRLCGLCMLRRRNLVFGSQNLTCPECNVVLDHIVCSVSSKSFSAFQIPGNPGPELIYDKKSRIYFPKDYYRSIVEKLWTYKCETCSFQCLDFEDFRLHLQKDHRSYLCELCFQYERQFPSEVQIFDKIELQSHIRGDESKVDSGHPLCTLCDDRFFNKIALVEHLKISHACCRHCKMSNFESGKDITTLSMEQLFSCHFHDTRALNEHVKIAHFICYKCDGSNFSVFGSENALRAHEESMHSTGWSNIAQISPVNQVVMNDRTEENLLSRANTLDQKFPHLSLLPGLIGVDSDINSQSMISESSSMNNWTAEMHQSNASAVTWNQLSNINSSDSHLLSPEFGASVDTAFSFEGSIESGPYIANEFPPSMIFNIQAAEFTPSSNFADVNPTDTSTLPPSHTLSGLRETSSTPASRVPQNLPSQILSTSSAYTDSSSLLCQDVGGEMNKSDRRLHVASSLNDDSLDFDAVMRLPLNFDDFDESLMSLMPSSSCSSPPSLLAIGAANENSPTCASGGNIGPLTTSETSNEGYLQYPSNINGVKQQKEEYHMLSSLGLTSLHSRNNGPVNIAPPLSWETHNNTNQFTSNSLHNNSVFYGNFGSNVKSFSDNSIPRCLDSLVHNMLPENSFPCVDWLRDRGMMMYRWTVNVSDWSQLALHIRREINISLLVGHDGSTLNELYRKTSCQVRLEQYPLRGRREHFMVFYRGPDGHVMNSCMLSALNVISDRLRAILMHSD